MENTEIPRDTVSAKFSEVDLNLFRVTLFDMLEFGTDGTARHWENAETGIRGRIKLVKTLEPKEPRCRATRISNYAKKHGLKTSNLFTFCRREDGSWSAADTAIPATDAAGGAGR